MQAIKPIFSAIIFSCLVFISPTLNGMQRSDSTPKEATKNNSPTLRESLKLLVDAHEWRAVTILFRVLFFGSGSNKTKQINIIKDFLYATVEQETIATMLCEECDMTKETAKYLLQEAQNDIQAENVKAKFGVASWEFDQI